MSTVTKLGHVMRGLAYGDAWGYPAEFDSYKTLTRTNPRGADVPERLIISDDTQMALAVARGLDAALVGQKYSSVYIFDDHLADEFGRWYDDPDNDRAPGTTCMAACALLRRRNHDWPEATVLTSDTCGAVMRVAPVAFLPDDIWAPAATLQAAMTHGAPGAIASSLILTAVIRRAARGRPTPDGALAGAIEFCDHIDPDCATQWLTDHPFADGSRKAAAALIAVGLADLRETLWNAWMLLPEFRKNPWAGDPSATLPGWRAKHAVAAALLCVDMLPDEPVEALRRATVTGGDSDSIACIAGALLGAIHGDPWPADWFGRLEPRYQEWLEQVDHYTYANTHEEVRNGS